MKNLMDTGIQLGRRFRALKLWMVLRYFGAEGIRARLAEHVRLARMFASWVDESAGFERARAGAVQRRLLPSLPRQTTSRSSGTRASWIA